MNLYNYESFNKESFCYVYFFLVKAPFQVDYFLKIKGDITNI